MLPLLLPCADAIVTACHSLLVTTRNLPCDRVLPLQLPVVTACCHCCYHWLPLVTIVVTMRKHLCYRVLPLVTIAVTMHKGHGYRVLPVGTSPCYRLLPLLLQCKTQLLPLVTACDHCCYHALTPLVSFVATRSLPCHHFLPLIVVSMRTRNCYRLLPLVTIVVTMRKRLCCYRLLPFVTIRHFPCYRRFPSLSPCHHALVIACYRL